MIAIHETRGKLAGSRVFDTYLDPDESNKLINYIENIYNESIIISFTFDDGFASLQKSAKKLFVKYGSKKINDLSFRGKWVFAFSKNGVVYVENLLNIKSEIDFMHVFRLDFSVPISKKITKYNCKNDFQKRREFFCENYVGYPEYCRCIFHYI